MGLQETIFSHNRKRKTFAKTPIEALIRSYGLMYGILLGEYIRLEVLGR
jgi:hypothetical protein